MESFFTCGPFTNPTMETASMVGGELGEEKKKREIYSARNESILSSDAIPKSLVDDNEDTLFTGSSLLHPPPTSAVSGFEINGDTSSRRTSHVSFASDSTYPHYYCSNSSIETNTVSLRSMQGTSQVRPNKQQQQKT